jgi:SNF2 family DNA or RNA helicase
MKLVYTGNRFEVISTFDEKDELKARKFKWDSKVKRWWTDKSLVAATLFNIAEMSDDLREKMQPLYEKVQQIEADRIKTFEMSRASDAKIEIPVPDGLQYMNFQKAGIAFALAKQNVLIGDQMGTGKTIQAIGVLNKTQPNKVLIVCPASVKLNWQKELEKWLTYDLSVGVVNGPSYPEADCVVINYDMLKRYGDTLKETGFDVVIVDEAHYIRNRKAQRTKLMHEIGKDIPRKMLLTGTPLVNRPSELFSLLNFIDPEAWPDFFKFAFRYCSPQRAYGGGWDFSGASNLDELNRRLRSTLMIRRLKEEVLTDLPDKSRQVILLPADNYKDVLAQEQEVLTPDQDPWDAYHQAQVKLNDNENGVTFEELARIRHETAMSKVDAVVEFSKGLLDNVDKIILFAHHHDVIDALEAGLKKFKPVRLTGRESAKQKEVAVETFQTNDKVRVFIGSITAAGLGITLTASSTVVFAELDWVPGNMTQAEDRPHRIGQKDNVTVYHVVIDGSLDARLVSTLISKQKVLDRATDKKVEAPKSILDRPTVKPTVVKPETNGHISNGYKSTFSDLEVAAVQTALTYLSARCDGAATYDGQGFNKFDAPFGKSLASYPVLTNKQVGAAMKMLKKYRTQIPEEVFAVIDN